ncbi:glutathione peroxidase [Marinicrinis sediminis]|uniref:Glutathione peroxidase n=1 Tax=Marinicrinis sediminis TaxID=1652465 RepID=A0ABW5REM9_9BACL
MKVFEYEARQNGKDVPLKDYKGKVLLIVNTASQCGFTPQYEGLQKLYDKYRDQGLEVLAFPCNQFGNQEPGNDEEIRQFCSLKYDVSFPVFDKVEVNGEQTHPLFDHLKEETGGLLGKKIKWNFTKFLVHPDGATVKRFAPVTAPEKLEETIQSYLKDVQA